MGLRRAFAGSSSFVFVVSVFGFDLVRQFGDVSCTLLDSSEEIDLLSYEGLKVVVFSSLVVFFRFDFFALVRSLSRAVVLE
ncbi:hypothetical protein HS088_TW08G00562 [Tripterygium wilfordii]|uniref:Uncharacterized protein n=1 Tax=Tripterygium wilfordii TaxID=458696 RepID=A0A7J7DCE5_TRIWF|nr:hypothetical protein HS088_TW08G00562 [Tripterygium wilfordii]